MDGTTSRLVAMVAFHRMPLRWTTSLSNVVYRATSRDSECSRERSEGGVLTVMIVPRQGPVANPN